ncbi:PRC and DUF2382 domain-containing protein [Actinoplanes sp. NBC_00393]|uniref:PRC and DUF2382 domain-containing protein n=1 Tax=Actinoplanes sp. NBC_00393 TaxID=2975953 RepID=UPI002E202CD2
MITKDDLGVLNGAEVYDSAGDRIGAVGQVYLDPHSGDPLWVTVRTGSLSFQESFVPLHGAHLDAGRLTVAVEQARIRQAPLLSAGGPLEQDDADRLSAHYGLTSDDDAMTRSEERLVTGTRREPAAKVRLRRYLVTEERQITVPVTREEVRLEQVPLGEEADSEEPGGAVTLHEQRPVVSTETVPVEHVRLTKQTVRGEETVTGTVRKEKIELHTPEEARGA